MSEETVENKDTGIENKDAVIENQDDITEDPTRTSQEPIEEINLEDSLGEIQRGIFPKPTFFGNMETSSNHKGFMGAVKAASHYASFIGNFRQYTRDENEEVSDFRLTQREFSELVKKASSISNYSDIPYDVVEDFLLILVYMDKPHHMKTIADTLQIAELADPRIIRRPMEILNVPNLERIAFCASALEGLIHMFRKYTAYNNNPNNKSGESVGDILDTIGSIVGGFGGNMKAVTQILEVGSSEFALGNFMSEMLTGKRIPMTVISKNPNLQSPSYVGKVFFGESPSPLANVDIDQLFNKPIAVFPKPSNGAGTTSFGVQNMGSFAKEMSVESVVSKFMTGSTEFKEATKKARQIAGVVNELSNTLGVRSGEILDLRRADTALPVMSAMSGIMSGTGKNVFSTDTFKNGWALSNSISSYTKMTDKKFMDALERFL